MEEIEIRRGERQVHMVKNRHRPRTLQFVQPRPALARCNV